MYNDVDRFVIFLLHCYMYRDCLVMLLEETSTFRKIISFYFSADANGRRWIVLSWGSRKRDVFKSMLGLAWWNIAECYGPC